MDTETGFDEDMKRAIDRQPASKRRLSGLSDSSLKKRTRVAQAHERIPRPRPEWKPHDWVNIRSSPIPAATNYHPIFLNAGGNQGLFKSNLLASPHHAVS